MSLEQQFNRVNEEKRRQENDYKARVETNLTFVNTLRAEIDDQKTLLNERKKQNADLYTEMDRLKSQLDQMC